MAHFLPNCYWNIGTINERLFDSFFVTWRQCICLFVVIWALLICNMPCSSSCPLFYAHCMHLAQWLYPESCSSHLVVHQSLLAAFCCRTNDPIWERHPQPFLSRYVPCIHFKVASLVLRRWVSGNMYSRFCFVVSDDGTLGCTSCCLRSFMLTSPRKSSKDSLVRSRFISLRVSAGFVGPIQVPCPEFYGPSCCDCMIGLGISCVMWQI